MLLKNAEPGAILVFPVRMEEELRETILRRGTPEQDAAVAARFPGTQFVAVERLGLVQGTPWRRGAEGGETGLAA